MKQVNFSYLRYQCFKSQCIDQFDNYFKPANTLYFLRVNVYNHFKHFQLSCNINVLRECKSQCIKFYSLCRGVRLLSKKECSRYDTVVRLLFWIFGICRVSLHCRYSLVYSSSEWSYLLGSSLGVKEINLKIVIIRLECLKPCHNHLQVVLIAQRTPWLSIAIHSNHLSLMVGLLNCTSLVRTELV